MYHLHWTCTGFQNRSLLDGVESATSTDPSSTIAVTWVDALATSMLTGTGMGRLTSLNTRLVSAILFCLAWATGCLMILDSMVFRISWKCSLMCLAMSASGGPKGATAVNWGGLRLAHSTTGKTPANPSAFLMALHRAALCSMAVGVWLPLATCFA